MSTRIHIIKQYKSGLSWVGEIKVASLDGFENFWVVVSTGSASCQDLNKKMKIDDITYVSI